jgi:prolyl 4-hydroxylase
MAEPQKPVLFSATWQDWLTENIVKGCAESDMVKTMSDSGFSPQFAQHAVAVVTAMTKRVQLENPSLLEPYAGPSFNFGVSENRVRAGDRDVEIVFAMENPNLAVIAGILTHDECDKLIRLSATKMTRSEVVDKETGRFEISGVRTSEGAHFQRAENAIVQRLEQRIAALTGHAVEHGEPLQILHYGTGGEYLPHHDYFNPAEPGSTPNLLRGGQRVATMVIYLQDVVNGGGTAFPEIEMTVRPRKGCAVYFEYCDPKASSPAMIDSRLLHAGLPVLTGDKWIATKWIRQNVY